MNSTTHTSPAKRVRLRVAWAMAITLGLAALVRPLSRIITAQLGIELDAIVPLLTTLAISVVWILVAGLRDRHNPLATLMAAGAVYAVGATLVSAVLSPVLDGTLAGPLAHPMMIPMLIVTNLVWGAITGVIAMAVQRIRRNGRVHRRADEDAP
ncbi:MAG TPA: hypothetical protein IAA98_09795 [Candidatus Avipropionibacterium avicola]|uniref:Uncharacterized protein n=1 Tax=Candidatus Avipropionibacterium avicola TaxID=2840701 RepID=A0A9D1GYQ3_9ACTN|nr:hypothetical protein [Candidatus Avipropionibacterium avicola]